MLRSVALYDGIEDYMKLDAQLKWAGVGEPGILGTA